MGTKKLCGRLSVWLFVLSLLLVFTGMPALAQWTTQTIPLNPGWNAVFLEVQPQPNDCDTIFAALPVESVWMWNRRFSTVQYIQDASTLMPEQPEWLVYLPSSSPESSVTNLFTLQGGRAYLIKLSGANPVDWEVIGKPVVRTIDWIADSFNLVGFWVAENSPPTFEEFFAPSLAHAGQEIHRLNDAGQWERVVAPATSQLRRGEAYWIYCQGTSTYSGPLMVTFEQGYGIDFGRILGEQTLRLRNESAKTRTVTLRLLSSLAPVDPTQPALAGPVPLSYWKSEADIAQSGWQPFPAELSVLIDPKVEVALRLEVRRRDMEGGSSGIYQSLIEAADGNGVKFLLPITAKGRRRTVSEAGMLTALEAEPDINAGLWVGMVAVNKVSQPTNPAAPNDPVPTASEFQFRILVHVDETGQARLLQQVVLMWKDGTYKPDPEDPEHQIVDEPGRFVLVTDDALLAEFSGATLRDGQPVGRRMSSAAFALENPEAMTGTFGESLSITLELDYNHPLNPFKHRYHPDHDNKDERFEKELDEGVESFTVRRNIELQFTEDDPEGLEIAGFGDRYMAGVYSETISGIHKQSISVEGIFRLHHVSSVPVLNDGL